MIVPSLWIPVPNVLRLLQADGEVLHPLDIELGLRPQFALFSHRFELIPHRLQVCRLTVVSR
jgi:hypothetical protein